jgi:prepilin-type N-terminal cleavage/methylation domain-containing protein
VRLIGAKSRNPRARRDGGFTITEVLVAVLILSVGMLALVSTAATVTRMIGQGQRFSEASTLAAKRFEILRATDCTAMSSSTATEGAYSLSWTVADTAGGNAKAVTLTVTSPTGRGDRTDTFNTTIACN